MEPEVDSFTVESVIRVYEEVCSVIEEVLVCHRDTRNRHDPLHLLHVKGTTLVRHIPYLDGYV